MPTDARSILIVTPAPRGSRRGNRVTALRWAKVLRALGHRVRLREHLDDDPADLLVALHARKSADDVRRCRAERPGTRIVVAVSGTDLYGDAVSAPEDLPVLELADRIVVLQERARESLSSWLQNRARVIWQSATPVANPEPRRDDAFEIAVVGHLRKVKDPLRAAEAARLLPAQSRVRIVHLGAALEPEWEKAAREEMARNPRYRWLGERSRAETRRIVARCRALAITSFQEGGANVVSEALVEGLPVIASRADGNVGMLGRGHPALYDAGDTRQLAKMFDRVERFPPFLEELQQRSRELAERFTPAEERRRWASLLGELGLAARPAEEAARFRLIGEEPRDARSDFARDVLDGLSRSPKRLHCRFFYDEAGSRLFEEICDLPEYTIPRAERENLERCSYSITTYAPANAAVVELGSGSARKTRLLFDQFFRHDAKLRYVPIDVSRAALEESARALLVDYPGLEILALNATYEEGLARLRELAPGPRFYLWLGSNVGNLRREEASHFLRRIRDASSPGDRLLLGVDLRKPREVLEPAYDDAKGVTARFNLNLLARINRELGGNFDLDAFAHRARYLEREGRIEMHLISRRTQDVRVDALGRTFHFESGEEVHTEDSYKYDHDEIGAMARAGGWGREYVVLDAAESFADVVLVADDEP